MLSYFNIRTRFNACDIIMKREEIILRKNKEDALKLTEFKNTGMEEQNRDELNLLHKKEAAKQKNKIVKNILFAFNW